MSVLLKRAVSTSFISSGLIFGLIFPTFAQEQTIVNLQIKRAIDAAQEIDKIPNAGEMDGDYTYFKLAGGIICGFLLTEQPRASVYVVCEDKVVSRPLTTVEEVEAVADLFAQQIQSRSSNAGLELTQKVQETWPTEKYIDYRVSKPN